MDYYYDYYRLLDDEQLLSHEKDKNEMVVWKEDLESFIFNYIDIHAEVGTYNYNLEMANRWYAIAMLAEKLGWDY